MPDLVVNLGIPIDLPDLSRSDRRNDKRKAVGGIRPFQNDGVAESIGSTRFTQEAGRQYEDDDDEHEDNYNEDDDNEYMG